MKISPNRSIAAIIATAGLVAASPGAIAPVFAQDATPQQQRACQNHAATAFPSTLRNDVQVHTVRVGEDGSASIRWQLPDGSYGFCRTGSGANLLEFGTYPGISSTTQPSDADPKAVCHHRLMQEFPAVSAERLTVSEVARSADGAIALKWQIADGESGFCSVTKTGEIFELGVNME
jgi:hypothetical protein